MGTVTTPNTVDMNIDGPVRLLFRARFDALTGTGFPVPAMKQAGGRDWMFYAYAPGNNGMFFSVSNQDFTSLPQVVIQQPITLGVVHQYGAEFTPGSANVVAIVDGVRTTFSLGMPAGAPNTTAPVQLGGTGAQMPGHLYWMQMEAINRAQLVFPYVVGNYLTSPNLWTTGGPAESVEILARVSAPWRTPPMAGDFNGIIYLGNRLGLRRSDQNAWNFYAYAGDGIASTSVANIPAEWTNGQMVWIRATNNATTMTLEWAPDSVAIPTTWTQLRSPLTTTSPGLRAASAFSIGTDSTAGTIRMWNGRIARLIVRNVIGGPAIFDLTENNAAVMAIGNTFIANSGQTVTVHETAGNDVVQFQPDRLIWRFDANEWPNPAPASWTDPRGRTWTQSALSAIQLPT